MLDTLAKQKISYNVDTDRLKDLEKKPIYQENILVATGVPPVNGIDGKADFKIRLGKSELKPKTNEDGTVNYRELDLVENVSKGQVLCVITPPRKALRGFPCRA
jgi:uncharacterized protein (DUF342 family)